MNSTPLPDHWAALGIDRTADAATIKKTYRKLVLTCHPDKVTVTDEALKKQKQDEFHKIQQAYEILSDDDRRATYEAELKLEALRKEKLARAGGVSGADAKSSRFDSRPSSGTSYPANTSQRYTTEERKPSRAYDDDHYFDGRRKYDGDDVYARASPSSRSSRPDKEPSVRTARPTTDRTRSDRNKTRDRQDRKDRKFVSMDSDSSADEMARHEAACRRRNADQEASKQAADARRQADEQRRSYDDARYGPGSSSTSRKLSMLEEEAIRYQHRARADVQADMRPSPIRTTSRDYYTGEWSSSRREPQARPEPVRRSSARPKERTAPSGRERDRAGIPEIVEWGDDRRPPTFKHSASSPADIHIPRSMPQRSYTTTEAPLPREYRRGDSSPPPALHRSSTLPTVPSLSSSRRKEATTRPSGLRETMAPELGGPERDHFSIPSAKAKHYYYAVPDLNAPGTHRTVLREPEHVRHRSPSPSPLSRPPIGVNRQSHESAYSAAGIPPPPMGRSSSSRNVSPVRGRPQPPLYGEINSDHVRRENARRRTSPHDMAHSYRIGPEDSRWVPRESGARGERTYTSKPGLTRTPTSVY